MVFGYTQWSRIRHCVSVRCHILPRKYTTAPPRWSRYKYAPNNNTVIVVDDYFYRICEYVADDPERISFFTRRHRGGEVRLKTTTTENISKLSTILYGYNAFWSNIFTFVSVYPRERFNGYRFFFFKNNWNLRTTRIHGKPAETCFNCE